MARGSARSAASQGAEHNTVLFLSLALLLLAFFVLLNAISTYEESRARKVMESIVSTFASPFTAPAAETKSGPVGDEVFAERYFDEVSGLFRQIVELVEVDVMQPGRLMRVTFPTDRLFAPGTAQIAAENTALIDALVEALGSAPAGLRLDLEMYISGGELDPRGIQVSRVGAAARSLVHRGAEPSSQLVGRGAGTDDRLVLLFHVRPAERPDLPLDPEAGR